MLLVDSHCHLDRLNLAQFGDDIDQMFNHAAEQNVQKMLCVSINMPALPGMLKLVDEYPQVYATVGIHPNESMLPEHEPSIDELVTMSQHPKVVAIGETGLDYYRSEGDLEWQRERFRRHIAAAKQTQLPLVIHSREARSDTLAILEQERAVEAGGVFHCFSEDWDTASAAIAMGFYISFSGIVTFKSAKTLQEVARRVPLDRVLLETDSPYLAPVPHRGRPNVPGYVRHVAEFVADLRGISVDELAQITTNNFDRLFSISPVNINGNMD